MGGDRDGLPGVTWHITARTLVWLRDTAIERHVEWCRRMYDFLSVSRNEVTLGTDLAGAVHEARIRWPDFAGTLARVPPDEIFRRWIRLIEWRLEQSRCTELAEPAREGAYRDGQDLERDVDALIVSLNACHVQRMLAEEVQGPCYTELCTSEDQRREIWMLIASEPVWSPQAISEIVGGSELLVKTPWFQGAIEVRNPDIDPLNLIQIELPRRRRKLDGTDDEPELQKLRDLLRLSVLGVAAGMRTTG